MRYKTFRSLTSLVVLTAALCLVGLPASAAPGTEAASPAVETGGWSAIWQWIGQLWSGGLLGQTQASTASRADTSDPIWGDDLQAARDFGSALDPNGRF